MAWNPGSAQIAAGFSVLKKYLSATEVLILNKEEAALLAKSRGINTASISKLLKVMQQWGPKIIAITQGEKGAYVLMFEPSVLKSKGN